jgi:dCMP deaminase
MLSKWDLRFLRIAEEVRTWSHDPSIKCGCVLVRDRRILATGYNGFPAGLSDSLPLYEDREYKLAVVIHAEKNSLFNAAKNGANTQGCTAYVTFPPCSQCASALVQAGVAEVVCPDPAGSPSRWKENFQIGQRILQDLQISVKYYSCEDLLWK